MAARAHPAVFGGNTLTFGTVIAQLSWASLGGPHPCQAMSSHLGKLQEDNKALGNDCFLHLPPLASASPESQESLLFQLYLFTKKQIQFLILITNEIIFTMPEVLSSNGAIAFLTIQAALGVLSQIYF